MSSTAAQTATPTLSARLTLLLATACGVIVANLYYAQPLVGPISVSTGLPAQAAGLIVTLTQVGYGLGLLFIVPLGDLMENRRLAVSSLLVAAGALVIASLSVHAALFLAASLLIGLSSVSAQVLVPLAAHFSPEHERGRAVGNVMSGLLLGIMLARPTSSLIADLLGWHAVFALSAGAIVLLATVLAYKLPPRHPVARTHYAALLVSMWHLLKTTPVLQRRALYQASAFGAFSLFWTTVPLELAHGFHLSQTGIALFSLAGVSGAIAAPLAGRLADRGLSRPGTVLALGLIIVSLLLPLMAGGSLAVLLLTAILLDMGVSANLVLGQRAIFTLGAAVRSRLNGLYIAIFFAGGAAGSAIGAWTYACLGWHSTLAVAIVAPVAALLYFASE
ncbi:MFS transporter [Pseudogulbenkiania subflava]|uniref:Predicted arabinose efflux permease, MFS family n=1 Tax=Pseudogulbenkiania subflava DSM 22618 TaxID=1123014 RepID=A0A1Y6C5Z4_9NEIS|nr:MFS transporter [Pseudogulbenkiania subflava]SMF45753.1 Predicted arabinose efflux permease, MFS family [Pseudogulbenkiania subflava DSM 22618]